MHFIILNVMKTTPRWNPNATEFEVNANYDNIRGDIVRFLNQYPRYWENPTQSRL